MKFSVRSQWLEFELEGTYRGLHFALLYHLQKGEKPPEYMVAVSPTMARLYQHTLAPADREEVVPIAHQLMQWWMSAAKEEAKTGLVSSFVLGDQTIRLFYSPEVFREKPYQFRWNISDVFMDVDEAYQLIDTMMRYFEFRDIWYVYISESEER